MNEETSIAKIKVVDIDLCTKCDEPMKTINLGGDSIFNLGGRGAFYCENKECEFFGFMTLARKLKTEKRVELEKEEKK